MNLEEAKIFMKRLDELQKTTDIETKEEEDICEKLADAWYKLSGEGRKELKYCSILLKGQWSDLERYKEAKQMLVNFPQPSENDKTSKEARDKQKKYWEDCLQYFGYKLNQGNK